MKAGIRFPKFLAGLVAGLVLMGVFLGSANAAAAPKSLRGVFALRGPEKPLDSETFSNPAVDGVLIRTFWKSVQPLQNQWNWNFIDGQVNAAVRSGKKVVLIVLPGAFTPSWALQGVKTAQFSCEYGSMKGQAINLPLPWDSAYLKRWFAFVQKLGKRYDANPAVVMVPMTGPTSCTAEMSLPNDPVALATWQKVGYTPSKYISAWGQTVDAYSRAFPNTLRGLVLFPGLPLPNASYSDTIRVVVANSALSKYGKKITIQTSGLSARKEDDPPLGYQLVKALSVKTTAGFEFATSATKHPDEMGDPDPVTALSKTIDFGLAAGADFLEVYQKDVLNPDMQPALLDAQQRLKQH